MNLNNYEEMFIKNIVQRKINGQNDRVKIVESNCKIIENEFYKFLNDYSLNCPIDQNCKYTGNKFKLDVSAFIENNNLFTNPTKINKLCNFNIKLISKTLEKKVNSQINKYVTFKINFISEPNSNNYCFDISSTNNIRDDKIIQIIHMTHFF